MKALQKILASTIGIIFMLSGFVKIIDPMGTAIKFEEYFHVFAEDVSTTLPFLESFFLYLIGWKLFLSVMFSSFEFILGVALLVNYRAKLMHRLTLLLLIFFGFLTFYSAFFDKVTDCGCFGDAIKFTPWGSFTKDLVLLVMLLVSMKLLPGKKRVSAYGTYGGGMSLQKENSSIFKKISIWVAVLFAFGMCYYAIQHLPPIDFRPYKIGNNISEMMTSQEPCVSVYYMEKDGEEKMFENYPTDTSWKLVRMETINEDECQPLIPDYYISNEQGEDFTEITTKGTKLLVIIQNVSEIEPETMEPINNLIRGVSSDDVSALAITSDATDFDAFKRKVRLSIPHYYADATVLKAVVRSNPGILLVKDGTILGKWHHNDTPKSEVISQLLNQE
ncbi:DoxX family protein [Flammeovirga sp. MY04]|uniref:BT_3928 family protein n=1 Tax=Flammeovirga sp. MY04 TaxID=1191459 RepID=UPI00080617F7|nr:BT_3928 family protein [Flammeovirga sp. MY04]ANQ49430.1 DoxX family protein [Flammeovirga sp. MY04]